MVSTTLLARVRDGMTFPVMMKEMRSRMRGARASWLLFISTGLTIGMALTILVTRWDAATGAGGQDPQTLTRAMADIGRSLFIGLMLVEGLLGAFIAPALTAGTISNERERQTLEFLLLTRLSGANIALGKLCSALSFLFMLLLCSLPVTAVVFLFGGVSPGQFC